MTTNLIPVPFHQEHLPATQGPDGTVWTPVRHYCDVLGLHVQGQQQRLQRQPWAGTCVMHVPSAGGPQTTVMMDTRTLPMWLATVQVSRVKPEAREALARYQKEAAEVLAKHFLDRQPARPAAAEYVPLPGSMPPGHTEATLADRVMELLQRWDSAHGVDTPLSAWRLGPMLGVHAAVVDLCMLEPVARGLAWRRPTKGGNGFEYQMAPFTTPAEKADKARRDARREAALGILETADRPVGSSTLGGMLRCTPSTAKALLLELLREGLVAELCTDNRPIGWALKSGKVYVAHYKKVNGE